MQALNCKMECGCGRDGLRAYARQGLSRQVILLNEQM